MFRFTIRELVLVTLVVGTGIGWCIDHSRQSATNRLLQQQGAKLRLDLLRAKELRGEVILSPMPR